MYGIVMVVGGSVGVSNRIIGVVLYWAQFVPTFIFKNCP